MYDPNVVGPGAPAPELTLLRCARSACLACLACLFLAAAACSEGASPGGAPAGTSEDGFGLAGAGPAGTAGTAVAGAAPTAGASAGVGAGAGGAQSPIDLSGGQGGAGATAPTDQGTGGDTGASSDAGGGAGTAGAPGNGAAGAAAAGSGGDTAGAGGSTTPPVVRDGDPTEASLMANGPYTVESYSLGFAIGPDFPGGTIWYPSDAEPPFASIAIVPGFLSPRVLIEGWGPFLASHGIVTFTIDTNSAGDQPRQRSAALLNALESLAAENSRGDSPLAGKLDNARQAVGGWSMGGGGTLITADGHPELKAAIAMCAWNPSGRFSSNRVPTLLFASSGDPLAGGQSQGFYTSIPDSTPKILFEWGLGDHLMANAPTGAGGQVGRFGLAWLKYYLEDDDRYRPFLDAECDGCTDFRRSL